MNCLRNGIRREGESCTKNNNCSYPNCLMMKRLNFFAITMDDVDRMFEEQYNITYRTNHKFKFIGVQVIDGLAHRTYIIEKYDKDEETH